MPAPSSRELNPPSLVALHYAYEKAGLRIDNQPIPWNAEAILVLGHFRISSRLRLAPHDFCLTMEPGHPRWFPLELDPQGTSLRVTFRLPALAGSLVVTIVWRGRPVCSLTIPRVGEADFLRHLAVQLPTVGLIMGDQTVACQSYVASQVQGAVASAILSSATSLVPLLDLQPILEVAPDKHPMPLRFPLSLNPRQLADRQALVNVCIPKTVVKHPWNVAWIIAGRTMARQPLRPMPASALSRSLRVLGLRYLVETPSGNWQVAHALPAPRECRRLGPCFILGSAEAGLAGWSTLQTKYLGQDGSTRFIGQENFLLREGPNPFVPGTVSAEDVVHGERFELWSGKRCLGKLSLRVAPQSKFTAEGAFEPVSDFTWSPAAESQLQERLNTLLQ